MEQTRQTAQILSRVTAELVYLARSRLDVQNRIFCISFVRSGRDPGRVRRTYRVDTDCVVRAISSDDVLQPCAGMLKVMRISQFSVHNFSFL
jgi:hypothetical protein